MIFPSVAENQENMIFTLSDFTKNVAFHAVFFVILLLVLLSNFIDSGVKNST